jgi:hypothetical protein
VEIDETLTTYIAAFNTTDNAERRRLLTACFAPEGTQAGAEMRLDGVEAIARHLEDFHEASPGFRATLSRDYRTSQHHPLVWCRVRIAFADGSTATSTPIIELDANNRIHRAVIFWGDPPADFD